MTRRALIVVDVQNDFCEGGSLAVPGGLAVATEIYSYMRNSADKYAVRVATLDYHSRNGDNGGHFAEEPDFIDSWPAHCVQGTPGAGFAGELSAEQFAEVFTKGDGEPAYSGFQGKGKITGFGLAAFLKEGRIDEVDVVGIAYDYCVKATALDVAASGLSCRVLKNMTASVNPTQDAEVAKQFVLAGVAVV